MSSIEMLNQFGFFDYVLTFFICSVIGWAVETTYCSLGAGKFINRGFLTGPLCPIYGTGALVFMITLTRFSGQWYAVLFLGMLFADIVEYITSFLMEKLFHARWWDYTEEFMNINGRICLKHTCYWGIASIVYIYVFQPIYLKIYLSVPEKIRYIVLAIAFFIFIIDLINAVRNAIDVRKLMKKVKSLAENVAAIREEIKNKFSGSKESLEKKYGDKLSALSNQIDETQSMSNRYKIDKKKGEKKKEKSNRIYTAYGNLQKTAELTVSYGEEILNELKKRITDENEEMF